MLLPHLPLAFLGNFMGVDGVVVLVIGLLLFGRKLPEVGKNLGKTIVEFKKGLNGTDSAEANSYSEPEEAERPAPPQRRISSGTRVSAQAPARKRLPETEEV